MKRFAKLLVAVAALTMVFALPVMANDDSEVKISSESTDQLIQLIDDHNLQILSDLENVTKFASSDAAMLDAKLHMINVYNQIRKEDQDICANHIVYLQNVVGNANENARVKKEILDNYTALCATNPQYAALIPQAQADYNAALAQIVDAQNRIVTAKAKFAKYYN